MAKKKRKSNFRGKVSANIEKRKSEQKSFGYLNLSSDIDVWKNPTEGRVEIDIIPYEVTSANHFDRDDENNIAVPGELWFKKPFLVHRNIGAENKAAICLKTFGERCPICEYRDKLMKEDGLDWNDDQVRALKPSKRNLYCVIPKHQKDYEEKPHIWDYSDALFQRQLDEDVQEDEEYELFPDLEEGSTLRIRFSEKELGKNKFGEVTRIDFKSRKEPYDESILEKVPDLDSMLKRLTYEQLEKMLFDADYDEPETPEEDDEDEEEEKPTKERKRKTKTPEPAPEDDEDEEEPEDEEDAEFEIGDMITWEYRNKELTGEIVEVTDKGYRAERDDNKRVTLVPFDKADLLEEEDEGEDMQNDKCPHGHRFGKDTDEFPECEDCDVWIECDEAKENA